jgi:hypothetical protein
LFSGYREVPTSSTGLRGVTSNLDPGAPASCPCSPELEQPGRHRLHRDVVSSGLHCSVLRKWPRRGRASGCGLCRPLLNRQNGCRSVELCSGSRIPPPARRTQKMGKRLGWNFENCIASTSVLYRTLVVLGVRASFPPVRMYEDRAISSYEEPTVDALAPDADEGRGWLRKATGSCLPSFDPWISEWGNPAGVMPSHHRLNT